MESQNIVTAVVIINAPTTGTDTLHLLVTVGMFGSAGFSAKEANIFVYNLPHLM